MSARQEQQPVPTIEKISGQHIDIDLVDPAHLRIFLEEHRGYKGLYSGYDDDLVRPIKKASLDYERDGSTDIVNINANIDFDAYGVSHRTDESWQDIIEDFLIDRLEQAGGKIYELQHEAHGFYVPLDSNYAAHVKLDSDTHVCSVYIVLERMQELDFALRAQNDELELGPGEETDFYQLFKGFSEILAYSIDAVVSNYGENKNSQTRPSITICAPNVTTSSLLEPVESNANNVLEKEQDSLDKLSFDMVGGLTTAKQRLEEIIVSLKNPGLATVYGIEASHFMLYGPAGTGKTHLIKAFSDEVGATLTEINSTDVIDMYVGNSAKQLEAIFNTAEEQSKDGLTVLFFDEINALIGKHGGSREYLMVVEMFKKLLTNASKNDQLIVAGATNVDIDQIDDAMIRSSRLEAIHTPAPNDRERVDVWGVVLWNSLRKFDKNEIYGDAIDRSFVPYDTDIDPTALAKTTEGMTGADFELILKRIRTKHMLHAYRTDVYNKVCQADIIEQINNFKR